MQQNASTGNITIGAGKPGTSVDISGGAGTRTLTGVAAGAVTATSTDAVNGSQLSSTNTTMAGIQTTVTQQGTAIAGLTAQVNNTQSSLDTFRTMVQSGKTGLVQQVAGDPKGAISIGGAASGTSVSMSGTEGARTVTGVKDGTIAAGSQDAVTGNQLNNTNNRVAAVETTTTMNTTAIASQGKQIAAHDVRLTSVEGIVTDHGQHLTTLDASVAGLQAGQNALGGRVDTLERKTSRNTAGIAAAMALPHVTVPAGKKFALGMDLSTYDGKQGIGLGVAGAINKTWSVEGGLTGSIQGGPVGVKGGFKAAW